MIGAIVKNDIVENVIVVNESQKEELEKALECEIVDARPYGLTVGDLRTARGWTRNAGGEQIALPELKAEQYDSYTLAMQRADEAEKQVEVVRERAAQQAVAVVSGQIEDESQPALMAMRGALDRFVAKIADVPKELNENAEVIRAWTPGTYKRGDVRTYEGVPYKCIQAHDSTSNETWNPTAAALWAQVHGTSRESARAWVQPLGSMDAYQKGEWVVHRETKYESTVDANVWEPGVSGWEERA